MMCKRTVHGVSTDSVARLKEKLAADARHRVAARYFTVWIVPALLLWAAAIAAVDLAMGQMVPIGVSLALYFSGTTGIVIGLDQWARRKSGKPLSRAG
jgi:hypothetical protein